MEASRLRAPPGRFQDPLGSHQSRRQLGELFVDENPQRLERPRRRMDLARLRADHAPDDVGERAWWSRIGAILRAATMARATARE